MPKFVTARSKIRRNYMLLYHETVVKKFKNESLRVKFALMTWHGPLYPQKNLTQGPVSGADTFVEDEAVFAPAPPPPLAKGGERSRVSETGPRWG